MRRVFAATLCSSLLLVLTISPASAEEKTHETATSSNSWSDQLSEDLSNARDFVVKLPRRTPGFIAGVIIGTPIAMVRRATNEMLTATKGQWEANKNPICLIGGVALGVPAGALSGIIDGAWVGTADAWFNADKPFSKDSFSLGEMK